MAPQKLKYKKLAQIEQSSNQGEPQQTHLGKAIQVIRSSLKELSQVFKENFTHLDEELKAIEFP